MQVTNVRVKPINDGSKVRAICSVYIDGAFAVHDLRVIDGSNGMFVSMPSKKTLKGDYRDVVHPVTREAREVLQQEILDAYVRFRSEQASQVRQARSFEPVSQSSPFAPSGPGQTSQYVGAAQTPQFDGTSQTSHFDDASQTLQFDPAHQASPFDPADQGTPFDPADQGTPFDPADEASPFEQAGD